MSSFGALTSKKERLYVPLGRGQAAHFGAGPKAALLDMATRAKLPVPPAIVLIDEAWQRARQSGLVQVKTDGSVFAPDPTRFVLALRLPNVDWEFPGPYAVRAAFSGEGGAALAQPGRFASRLDVDERDPAGMAAAICDVWASAGRDPAVVRRDVLIMRMVAAKTGGEAHTRADSETDTVLRRHAEPNGSAELPRLRAGLLAGGGDTGTWQGRLQ
ncbi:MAG: hypothetical protein IT323_09655, partial [Anaerolineae bacterium]|nr:hypothetical protein [Anaerolineae bacterium]